MSAERRHRPGRRAAATAVAGAAWILVSTVVAGLAEPGYSHVSQFMSELGARGAANGEVMSLAGFLPAGILLIAFAFFAARAAPGGMGTAIGFAGIGIYALGYVTAAFFRCDPGCDMSDPSLSQVLHMAFGLAGYFTGPVAILGLGIAARGWPDSGALPALGIVGGPVGLAALALMDPAPGVAGLAQRALEGIMLAWIVLCGLYLGGRSGVSTS